MIVNLNAATTTQTDLTARGQLDTAPWLPAYRDRPTLIASRERFVPRFVAENAWLIPAHHIFPAIGRVEAVMGGGHRWVEGGA